MLCFREDEYLLELQEDRGNCVWFAELSDGTTVFQDDGRPDAEPPQAWLRLRQYLRSRSEQNHLFIRRIGLKFRSIVFRDILPIDATGYFFSQGCIACLGDKSMAHFFSLGWVTDDNLLQVQRWKVPELIHLETEIRKVPLSSDCLIWNVAENQSK